MYINNEKQRMIDLLHAYILWGRERKGSVWNEYHRRKYGAYDSASTSSPAHHPSDDIG